MGICKLFEGGKSEGKGDSHFGFAADPFFSLFSFLKKCKGKKD